MVTDSSRLTPRMIRDLARKRGGATGRLRLLASAGPQIGPLDLLPPAIARAAASPGRAEAIRATATVPSEHLVASGFEELGELRVVRAGDLFNGVFRFYNLHRNTLFNQAQKIEGNQPAYLTLELPGQHLGEQAMAGSGWPSSPGVRARLAGRSQIAVEMPEGSVGLRIALEDLLEALASWPLSLDPLALYQGQDQVNPAMLEAAAAHFDELTILMSVHLIGMGLTSVWAQGLGRVGPLVDSACAALQSGMSSTALYPASLDIRQQVEAAVAEVRGLACDLTSGPDEGKRHAADVAEALLEIAFANDLARRFLEQATPFVPGQLSAMSGLFDLMMFPHPPAGTATALELPYRLITSPGTDTRFDHGAAARVRPYQAGERIELWHSRLRQEGPPSQDLPRDGVDFFALWSPDYMNGEDLPGFTMSLDGNARRKLVKRTSGHNEDVVVSGTNEPYEPVAAKVRALALSPLGATLDAEGHWPEDWRFESFGQLVGWLHRIELGRDRHVVVVSVGWLYPLGVPVSKVVVTERKFQVTQDGERLAVLRQRSFVVVRQAVLGFPETGQAHKGRGLPFTRIEAVTRVSPDLGPEQYIAKAGEAYWVKAVGGVPVPFDFAGTDHAGRTVGFSLPQIFVPGSLAALSADRREALATEWAGGVTTGVGDWPDTSAMPKARMAGQIVRLMPGDRPELDLPLVTIALTARKVTGDISEALDDGRRPFHPFLEEAEAFVPIVAEITSLQDEVARQVKYCDKYLNGDFASVANAVVLELRHAIPLDFAGDLKSDTMGALGQASQQIAAIGANLGPLPLPDRDMLQDLVAGKLDWQQLLPDFKVLGRFLLYELLEAVGVDRSELPTFTTRRDEQELKREWRFQHPIRTTYEDGPISLSPSSGRAEILLEALIAVTLETLSAEASAGGESVGGTVPTGLRDPRAEARGHITDIDIALFGVIEVRFDEIAFEAVAGQKPTARVTMASPEPLVFLGPLEFVNVLRDLIPPTGFGDGPRIVLGPLGVAAGFDLGLPNVEVGVFALKNMTLGAEATLPFDQRPVELRFFFNERHRPFEIAVSAFGGGGFFALALDAGGIREIEAALEFGAQVSLNIGVASGGVSVKGGIYFRFATDELVLEGYVELRGRLSILELITASLLFHLALAYEKRAGQAFVRGEATLRVEVEVLFFSASVTLHVEREFEAGGADPRLVEMMAASDWAAYCEAFA